MPHRPSPRGYEAFDIWLGTQDSAKDALGAQRWSRAQQTHIRDFDDYASINKFEDKRGQTHFRERRTGKFVKGY